MPPRALGKVAVSIAKARAEAAAQLGERLATIQLLRDGLYRACEAYSNGAFSEITYAVLLSQYDDTMISLMMGELAAGNFGRELATLGGNSMSKTSAKSHSPAPSTDAGTAPPASTTTEATADTAPAAAGAIMPPAPSTDAGTAPPANSTTEATAAAAPTAAGVITHTVSPEIAKTLHKIQRKYIENINADALVVACVTAMSRDEGGKPSELSQLCKGNDGILKNVLASQQKLLRILKVRTLLEELSDKARKELLPVLKDLLSQNRHPNGKKRVKSNPKEANAT